MEPSAPAGKPIPRFLADAMLGRLATWLRILGYDTEYSREEDGVLVRRAREEGRILLTRDTGLLRRADLPAHLFVRSDRVRAQLREVLAALGLNLMPDGPRRCVRCNRLLQPRDKVDVAGRVPDFIWSQHSAFWGCPVCGRIYWAGSHRRHMDDAIHALMR